MFSMVHLLVVNVYCLWSIWWRFQLILSTANHNKMWTKLNSFYLEHIFKHILHNKIQCFCDATAILSNPNQWRRSQVKRGINIEKIEGVGSGEGLCPPQFVVCGLAPEKNNLAQKIMQFWASFGTSSLYYSRKWGDYPPVLKVGGHIPLSPLLRRLWS